METIGRIATSCTQHPEAQILAPSFQDDELSYALGNWDRLK